MKIIKHVIIVIKHYLCHCKQDLTQKHSLTYKFKIIYFQFKMHTVLKYYKYFVYIYICLSI